MAQLKFSAVAGLIMELRLSPVVFIEYFIIRQNE